jgi:hypothetical protein
MTLPEVVTGELASKFGEISLSNQHADFELGSASNSNSTSPHPASAPRVAPATSAGPAQRLRRAPGRQGARTRVQLGLRHRSWSRFGLKPPLRLLLGLRVRDRLRVRP